MNKEKEFLFRFIELCSDIDFMTESKIAMLKFTAFEALDYLKSIDSCNNHAPKPNKEKNAANDSKPIEDN